ncbi:MAG TPA: DCC1-like thiol-disulfide oxidoreductase family protein [Candidatus Dormibacteraeota bacterium]|nr:DCC1-like thiol-disulfide oxidoreductase family protein [Candidatus Dormibacteraeota bacterium]
MRRARWVQRLDLEHRIELAGLIDAPALLATEPGGAQFFGAAAVNRVLRELGGAWRMLGSLYLLPPIGWLEDRYYSRVARKRAWW